MNLRCGVCGDKTPDDQQHSCWAMEKLQEYGLPVLCSRCGDPLIGEIAHWRCWEKDHGLFTD